MDMASQYTFLEKIQALKEKIDLGTGTLNLHVCECSFAKDVSLYPCWISKEKNALTVK